MFFLTAFKVHIIHVGNMNNKGTRALLKSDVYLVNEIFNGDVFFSVSTTDIEGVRSLNLPFAEILPPIVDIPYEAADHLAKKFGYSRDELKYKVFALASLFYMFVQAVLSVISIIFVQAGLRAFYRAKVINQIKNCDLVVSCSNENFKESASLLPLNFYWVITWWSMLFERAWEILAAKFLGKSVVMFPNSVGPFRTWIGRFLSKLSLNSCDHILVREPISYEIVKSLSIRSPKILTFETTLLFKSMGDSSFDNYSNPVIGVSPGIYSHSLSEKEVYEYVLAHAKVLDRAVEKYGLSVVFLPHYISGFRYDDLEISKLIFSEMKNASKARIVNMDTVDEFKSLIDRMDMAISSKMHPAVLATSGCVPTLCIAYDHKQTGFFRALGLSECVIPLRDLSYEKLLSKMDYVWNRRDEIRSLLKERIPKLQEHVKNSIKKVMSRFEER